MAACVNIADASLGWAVWSVLSWYWFGDYCSWPVSYHRSMFFATHPDSYPIWQNTFMIVCYHRAESFQLEWVILNVKGHTHTHIELYPKNQEAFGEETLKKRHKCINSTPRSSIGAHERHLLSPWKWLQINLGMPSDHGDSTKPSWGQNPYGIHGTNSIFNYMNACFLR